MLTQLQHLCRLRILTALQYYVLGKSLKMHYLSPVKPRNLVFSTLKPCRTVLGCVYEPYWFILSTASLLLALSLVETISGIHVFLWITSTQLSIACTGRQLSVVSVLLDAVTWLLCIFRIFWFRIVAVNWLVVEGNGKHLLHKAFLSHLHLSDCFMAGL